MANAIFPDVAELRLALDWISQRGNTWLICLYQSDTTPSQDTILGELEEADYTGYARLNWDVTPPLTVGHKAVLPPAFAYFTGPSDSVPQDVYGWYVLDSTAAELILVARFADAPRTLSSLADIVSFNLALSLFDFHQ